MPKKDKTVPESTKTENLPMIIEKPAESKPQQVETPVKVETKTEDVKPPKSKIVQQAKVVNTQVPQPQPKKAKKHHYSFFVISILFGILLTGGGLYYTKYPYGYQDQKIEEIEFPKVLAVEDQAKVPEVYMPLTLPPQVTGKAYGIFYKDKKNSEFMKLSVLDESEVLPLASITKLMTALVTIDQYELDREVIIPLGCVNIKDGSNVGFLSEEVFTVQDLLYGLLVKSGADAGCALANIDKSQDFVDKMNQKAKELGMTQTKFQNVIGFDAGDNQVSTINDLKILSEEVLKSSVLRKIIGTQVIEIAPKNNTTKYRVETTNDLLKNIPGTIGIKTGYTELAGECLSYLYSDKNHEILIVILGSAKRFDDTRSLLDWAKKEIASGNLPKS